MIRLGLLADYPEEGWPSMDLTAAMTREYLTRNHSNEVNVTPLVPRYRNRVSTWPGLTNKNIARNLDRLINRNWDYPQRLKTEVTQKNYDLFHVTDHSYSHLAHALPSGKVVITCHDLDTFRCLLDPNAEPRPRWFRAMTTNILDGFRKADGVACDSDATREAILEHDLLPAHKLVTIPLGVAPEFNEHPHAQSDANATQLLGEIGPVDLLHVGSTIPRKRIDVLLDLFAEVRRHRPDARLIKVGSHLNVEQSHQAETLGLTGAIVQLPFLDRSTVAAIYRRSALVLQPSEAEGFGLPVIEAMACGAVVIASDIKVLREVGGQAVVFCPVGDSRAWATNVLDLINERNENANAWHERRAANLLHSRQYLWSHHARELLALYQHTLQQS